MQLFAVSRGIVSVCLFIFSFPVRFCQKALPPISPFHFFISPFDFAKKPYRQFHFPPPLPLRFSRSILSESPKIFIPIVLTFHTQCNIPQTLDAIPHLLLLLMADHSGHDRSSFHSAEWRKWNLENLFTGAGKLSRLGGV